MIMPDKDKIPQKEITLKAAGKEFNVIVMACEKALVVTFQINNASDTVRFNGTPTKSVESLFEKFDKKAALKLVREEVKTRFKQMKVVAEQITS